MIAFYIVIALLILIIYFSIAFIYKPLGGLIKRLFGDAIDIMKDDEEKSEDEKK